MLIEALIGLVVEILGEVLFAIAGAVLEQVISDENQSNRVLAASGDGLIGVAAGGVSVLILRRQMVTPLVIPGASLIVAPLCTGALLELLGRWWVRRGYVRMALFTFWGGFWFAFGMALVRFGYFARPWIWL